MRDEEFYNRVGGRRISDRQIDELIGLAHGLAADGALNQQEVEFLQRWLAANAGISGEPLIATLYRRVNEVLRDGVADDEERADLLAALGSLSKQDVELGEALKPATLPLCTPAPTLTFIGRVYCFTGTFNFGARSQCEQAIVERGGSFGNLRKSTHVLVIGAYATESWKHSTYGNKIIKACEMRTEGVSISIVCEDHWVNHL